MAKKSNKTFSYRDPIAHRRFTMDLSLVDKKETRFWESHYGLIMRCGTYLVCLKRNKKNEVHRVCKTDYETLQTMGVI